MYPRIDHGIDVLLGGRSEACARRAGERYRGTFPHTFELELENEKISNSKSDE
jgi:hypothetical protein